MQLFRKITNFAALFRKKKKKNFFSLYSMLALILRQYANRDFMKLNVVGASSLVFFYIFSLPLQFIIFILIFNKLFFG